MKPIEKVLYPAFVFAILVLVWNQASHWFPPDLLPGPMAVLKSLKELTAGGMLAEHLRVSLYRFGTAYLAAALTAIPLGLLFGRYLRLWAAFDPLAQILRPIAPIAWMPLVVLWFGIGDLPTMVIIFIAAFFPILLTTVAAVKNVDPVYLKVARNFNTGELALFQKVIIPAAFPQVTVGLRLAIGTAWVFLVVGEMIGVRSGLGYLIIDGRNSLRYDWVIAAMLMIGVTGLCIDRLVSFFENWVKRKWGYIGR